MAGCVVPGDGSQSDVVNRSIEATDANGVFLGYVIDLDVVNIKLWTSKGYYLAMHWDGTVLNGSCFWTGPNGTGTPYGVTNADGPTVGFAVPTGGTFYVAASLDSNGFAVTDPTVTSYESYWTPAGVVNYAGTLKSGDLAVRLKQVPVSDVGLPSSIASPVKLVFK